MTTEPKLSVSLELRLPRRRGPVVLDALERSGLLLLFAGLCTFFVLHPQTSETFATKANLRVILASQAVTALLALAFVVPLKARHFDISAAASIGLSNVLVATMIGPHGYPVWLGVAAGCLVPALLGFFNGFLVAKLKLDSFIATFGVFILVGGVLAWYTRGESILQDIPRSFGTWGTGLWLGVPRLFLVVVAVVVIMWYVLENTAFGRHLDMIGANEEGARLVGISVDRMVWASFTICGFLAGLAGVILTSRTGVGDSTTGPGYLFPAFAGVFLGATTILPGRYNVWGTAVAVYFVGTAVSGFTLLGASVWVSPVFNGGALVVAVALSTLLKRARDQRAAKLSREETQELQRELRRQHPEATRL